MTGTRKCVTSPFLIRRRLRYRDAACSRGVQIVGSPLFLDMLDSLLDQHCNPCPFSRLPSLQRATRRWPSPRRSLPASSAPQKVPGIHRHATPRYTDVSHAKSSRRARRMSALATPAPSLQPQLALPSCSKPTQNSGSAQPKLD